MVFVTVGNATQGFSRLVHAVGVLRQRGELADEQVVVQWGNTPGAHAGSLVGAAFYPLDEFNDLLKEASLVITHGGCTVLSAIRLGKLPVVMPRRRTHGEHANDHQYHFTRALASEGLIIPAYEVQDLGPSIRLARTLATPNMAQPAAQIHRMVKRLIDELASQGPA